MKLSGEAVGKHLHHLLLAGYAGTTVAARARALTRLQAGLGGPLLAAGPAELLAWRESLDVAPKTVRDYVSHAHQFYEWAAARGLVAANPAAGIPVPRAPRRLPRPIAEADLIEALAAAPGRVRPWLVLAGWAGLRAKEIALLRRENVLDYAPRPVLIVAADATKGIRERVVPMSAFVQSELRPHLPARGWVFGRADGGRGPVTPARVSQLANQVLHSQGFTATLHQLRHRFASQAYQASRDLRAVQALLGHADPASTAGYAAHDDDSAAAAVEALPVPRLRAVDTG